MTEILLEARDLHTYYGASHVLRGVSLTIHRGEAVGLMGRNGMGKTTLLRSLLRLTPFRRGELTIRGRRMSDAPPYAIARSGIAYVPEDRRIFSHLTVRENLTMAARPNADGERPWTVERVLTMFPRLAERLHRGGDQLSGGEQQMLAIGRALLTNPALMILDETTEGLAPLVALDIWRTIREIRASGVATIIVDKQYAAVTAVTDRNLILVKGEVALEGTSAALRAKPDLLHKYLGI